nr:methyltransferase [Actinospica robiniae]
MITLRPSARSGRLLLTSLLGPALVLAAASPSHAGTVASAAVRVCGHGPAAVRPVRMILTCADRLAVAEHLHWTRWSATEASATGLIVEHSDAASKGTVATFTLRAPAASDAAERKLFTELDVQVHGANPGGFPHAASFSEAAVPAAPTHRTHRTHRRRPQRRSADAADTAGAALGYAQVEGFWVAAGGPSSLASTVAAITAAESRSEPGVIQTGEPFAKTGWGLWQITPGNSAPSAFGSDYQLLDPWNNAEAAVWKYEQQGLNAWSTYYDGAYKSYVQQVSPDTSVTDPGEFAPVNAAPSDTPSSPVSEPGSTYGPSMAGPADGISFGQDQRAPHHRVHHPRYAPAMADDTWAGLADKFADGAYATVKGRVRTYVMHNQLLEHLPPPPARVLDVGGGAGHQSFPLAQAGYEVTLLDPSAAMLDKASARLAHLPDDVRQRVTFVEAAGENADEATGGQHFDAVLCHGVLGYLDHPEPLLDQLIRRTAPGGIISIMAGNADAAAVRPALEGRWEDALAAFDARSEIGVLGLPTRADTVEELSAQLRDRGAEPLAWYGVWHFVDWLDLSGSALDPDDAKQLEAVAAVELEAGHRDPYRQLSRIFHLVARKGSA